MAGKFELNQSSNGKFYFNLKAGNGQIILSSQMYDSKAGARPDPGDRRAGLAQGRREDHHPRRGLTARP